MLRRPFQLGKLSLPSNIFCAPLAGCSDLPFRKMTSPYRPGLMFCEMVKMDALVRHEPRTYRLLDYDTSMHPIGAQLCGSKAALAAPAARILEELGFDVIDLNCGCPVDKVTKDGSGSGLLQNLPLIGEILSNIRSAVTIPVTVKIRAGWDEASIVAPQIVQIAESIGVSALTIHGRTRKQGYQGNANWDWIRACKEKSQNMLIIGNGDLFHPEKVEQMFRYTGCDGVLVARGTLGSPWIIEDIYRHYAGEVAIERSGLDYRNALLEHLDYVTQYHPPRKAAIEMRRIGCWYLKHGKGTRKLREWLNQCHCIEEIRTQITDYPWEDTDFSIEPTEI